MPGALLGANTQTPVGVDEGTDWGFLFGTLFAFDSDRNIKSVGAHSRYVIDRTQTLVVNANTNSPTMSNRLLWETESEVESDYRPTSSLKEQSTHSLGNEIRRFSAIRYSGQSPPNQSPRPTPSAG